VAAARETGRGGSAPRTAPTPPSRTTVARSDGMALLEVLVGVTLASLLFVAAAPTFATLRSAGRTAAGAREIAITLQAQRWQSVATGRSHGLWFTTDARGWAWRVVRDGNGNGLRTAEVRDGTDAILSGPHRLEDRLAPTRLGLPTDGAIPEIPPRRGRIPSGTDPVQFGRTDLVSFSPQGTASSGTLYVTDGRDLFGIVLFGATARVRVWRYDGRAGRWRL